jgi:hypothetical protein
MARLIKRPKNLCIHYEGSNECPFNFPGINEDFTQCSWVMHGVYCPHFWEMKQNRLAKKREIQRRLKRGTLGNFWDWFLGRN